MPVSGWEGGEKGVRGCVCGRGVRGGASGSDQHEGEGEERVRLC